MTGILFPPGGLAWPKPPDPGGAFSVRGGVGGMQFQWQELTDAAARLGAVADDADAVYGDLMLAQLALQDPRLAWVPSRVAAQSAVAEAAEVLDRSIAEIRDLAGEVAAAHVAYRLAEEAAAWGMDQVHGATWWASVPLGMAGNEGRPTRDGTELAIVHGPAALAALMGLPPSLARSSWTAASPREAAAVLVGTANTFGLLRTAPVSVAKTDRPAGEMRLEPTAAALLERAQAAADAGPGTIEILEVRTPQGTRWVVTLPGTQAASSAEATANPFDETGVAEALAGNSRHTAAAVSAALAEAGAAAADPVVLVGYSQGGMHAANLAASEEFRAAHNVAYVLTAGSPVGGTAIPEGTAGLHLEHVQDWVPGADGRPNPDTRDRVTVTLAGRAATPEGEGAGLGPGHDFANYVEGARRLEGSRDPSVAAGSAVLGAALAGGGAARRHLVTLRRELPPKNVPKAAPLRLPSPPTPPAPTPPARPPARGAPR
ncbi:hypothetical protein [Arthrobacter mangrovi]|uniref:PE-PPE domain-containing protein n=1 Tax=Arthrobacter mangrovi TaxID=2966350 RepID=A0ABQ5MQZ0_9MICC|nr:hypothetical protein [Arthrobacter mangrovi]GLB66394.1 hypothetical protein AHIS1636_08330 [Arthrobacter mangrovi]